MLAIHDEGHTGTTWRDHISTMRHLLWWYGHRQMMRMVSMSTLLLVL